MVHGCPAATPSGIGATIITRPAWSVTIASSTCSFGACSVMVTMSCVTGIGCRCSDGTRWSTGLRTLVTVSVVTLTSISDAVALIESRQTTRITDVPTTPILGTTRKTLLVPPAMNVTFAAGITVVSSETAVHCNSSGSSYSTRTSCNSVSRVVIVVSAIPRITGGVRGSESFTTVMRMADMTEYTESEQITWRSATPTLPDCGTTCRAMRVPSPSSVMFDG